VLASVSVATDVDTLWSSPTTSASPTQSLTSSRGPHFFVSICHVSTIDCTDGCLLKVSNSGGSARASLVVG
jgi:hypothetical protein